MKEEKETETEKGKKEKRKTKKAKEETGKPVKKEKNSSDNLLEGSQNRLASSRIMGRPVASDAGYACAFCLQFDAVSGA